MGIVSSGGEGEVLAGEEGSVLDLTLVEEGSWAMVVGRGETIFPPGGRIILVLTIVSFILGYLRFL
jgi:hypothetical protein